LESNLKLAKEVACLFTLLKRIARDTFSQVQLNGLIFCRFALPCEKFSEKFSGISRKAINGIDDVINMGVFPISNYVVFIHSGQDVFKPGSMM